MFLYFQCILASIIIVALQGMFRQFFELPKLWKLSKIDFVSIYILGVNSERNFNEILVTIMLAKIITLQLWEESLLNNHLSSKTIMLKKEPLHMVLEIQILACGRVKPMNGILTHLLILIVIYKCLTKKFVTFSTCCIIKSYFPC